MEKWNRGVQRQIGAGFFEHRCLLQLSCSWLAGLCIILFSSGADCTGDRNVHIGDRVRFLAWKYESGRSRGSKQRWVLVAFLFIGLLDAYVPAYTDRKGLLTIDGETVRWLGVVLFAAGGGLRLWPVFVLVDRFSGLVAIQSRHTLATDGIYRVIRHPSYLGLLINSLGWALAFRSGAGILLALAMLPPLLARIRAEEALLEDQFGDEYRSYRARTSRLIHRLY